VREIFSSF